MMRDYGYPTEQELERIAKWPHEDLKGMMDFIHNLWSYADWGWQEEKLKDAIEYKISTAGWSGNEDIIRAMQENEVFWIVCWQQSRRGGHYTFHVK